MSIVTKTGDDGSTALMFGRRVLKTDVRVAAYGSIDELNAAIGAVRAFSDDADINEALLAIQAELVTVMGELAVAPQDLGRYVEKGFKLVTPEMAEELTARVYDLERNHRISFQHWATPGATRISALLDVARTVCRRAERGVITLRESGEQVNAEAVRYLNRLSDLLWLYARWFETKAGVAGDAPVA